MVAKSKEKIIEKITYQHDNQSIRHREIYEHKNLKIKLELESDSYSIQCWVTMEFNLFSSPPRNENSKWTSLYN